MEQNLKINQIVSFTQKSKFGEGKYYGYSKEKFLGIIKIGTNKKFLMKKLDNFFKTKNRPNYFIKRFFRNRENNFS